MDDNILFRTLTLHDEPWVNDIIEKMWGSINIVVHSNVYTPSQFKGFLAECNNQKIGLITYIFERDYCEILTLNSLMKNKGVGTGLVNLVISEALNKNCSKLILTTTNDNIYAIYFFQKNGFKLNKIRPNAVKESRKLKPEIPLVAANGIQISDEIELIMDL